MIALKIKMRQEEEERERKRLEERKRAQITNRSSQNTQQPTSTQRNSQKLVLESSAVEINTEGSTRNETNQQTNPQNVQQQNRPQSVIPQRWQDYIPENIAMDLQNQNVDYDAIMLNEAIKRSLGNSGTPP